MDLLPGVEHLEHMFVPKYWTMPMCNKSKAKHNETFGFFILNFFQVF